MEKIRQTSEPGKLTRGGKMVKLFLPLWQAAKLPESGSAIAGEVLDKALLGERYDPHVRDRSRVQLMIPLRGAFAPYGITIQTLIDPKDSRNGKAAQYRLNCTKPVFETEIFLKLALLEGAHKIQPIDVRKGNIVGIYYGSKAIYSDIARMYGFTSRERPSQLIKSGMRHLWENCSEDLQAAFPFEDLKLGKPMSLKSRRRQSLAKGGKSVIVAQALKTGETLVGIKRETGLTATQIASARSVLREWGVEVPYSAPWFTENPRLLAALQTEEDPEKIRELLGLVTSAIYNRDRRSKKPVLSSVYKLARQNGFHHKPDQLHLFMKTLEQAGIPFLVTEDYIKNGPKTGQVLRYHIILTKHTEAAIQAFLENPDLKRFHKM